MHTKKWDIIWIITYGLTFAFFLSAGIVACVKYDNPLLALYFWILGLVWVVALIRVVVELIKKEYLTLKALNELADEELELKKKKIIDRYGTVENAIDKIIKNK